MSITPNNALKKVQELKDLLVRESQHSVLDLSECIAKLQTVINSSNDSEIKIVLLGSFSDGKTSTIAGLMHQVMENMKIDSDESSDELTIYRPSNIKKGFVIIDTPGLFGSKDREIDGQAVKFSSITERFISEAHIVLYVTSAVAPVKDSHSIILQKVLRELGKLNSCIFVLNKMDETGVNITDDYAYRQMVNIKTDFLIQRLKGVINLTEAEAKNLNVVCISADPKRKGVEAWLNDSERYNNLSRIPQLQMKLDSLIGRADTEKLQKDAYLSTINEMYGILGFLYTQCIVPLRIELETYKEDSAALNHQMVITRDALLRSKSEMTQQVDQLRKNILRKISEASYEEIGEILRDDIGIEGDKVTYYAFMQEMNGIINRCAQSNQSSLEIAKATLEDTFNKQDSYIKSAANKGLKYAAKGINNKVVLKCRDLFFKSFKFKPRGAVKLAGKISVGLNAFLIGIDIYGKWKRDKNLKKMQEELTNAINTFFAQFYPMINSDESYYKNFASSFIEMQNMIQDREKELDEMRKRINETEHFKTKLNQFFGKNIEYAEFEEV